LALKSKEKSVIAWLLEENQPSIRYLTMTSLLGLSGDDPEAVKSKEAIPKRGWAADILGKRKPGGWWVGDESLYRPKYISTNWMLLVLSDLGITKENPSVRTSCELWVKRFAKKDGGFGADNDRSSHLCIVGNTARALVKFGYETNPQVRSAFEWMVENQAEKGGWSCFGSGRNLDSWEPMSAFAVYPKQRWTRNMKEAVGKGAEFFLERELHNQGGRYGPWYRFHYPTHYYYDLLVGLDFITALGYGDDRRLKYAISLLKEKRGPDGKWKLDAVHPDLEGGMAKWYSKKPPIPFALEKPGSPSKMITLIALKITQRLNQVA
jgi:hypothetical protein